MFSFNPLNDCSWSGQEKKPQILIFSQISTTPSQKKWKQKYNYGLLII